jgi:hypothetical protein
MNLKRSEEERLKRLEEHYVFSLLSDARDFVAKRGTYYYGHDMRGPGSDLVKRIELFLKEKGVE